MQASDIISRARELLHDTSATPRWSDAELLSWVSDGQRRVVRLRPKLYVKTTQHQLQPGVLQSLPADGMLLHEVTRNLGTTGSTPGRSITRVEKRALDIINPDWPSDAADDVVQRYIYDPGAPLQFYVYPPQPAAPSFVEIVYTPVPPVVSNLTDQLVVPDDVGPIILDYVMYRALSRDAPSGDNAAATQYYNGFLSGVNGL